MTIKLCKRCVNPSSRPNIFFDDRGVCPVCCYEEEKASAKIDWNARRLELERICDWGKKEALSSYDCMVAVSGGKDSTRQACYARDELGMNPLLVSCAYPPEQMMERGANNVANLINLGFDTLMVSPNPDIWKSLMKEGFFRFGNWARSTEMALYAIPIHVAIAYQIPLIFYGENPAWTVGEQHGHLNGDASQLKKGNTISGGPDVLLPESVSAQDAYFYYYPSDNEMESACLRMVYLGYYMEDWSGQNNAKFSIERGLEVRNESPEMTGDLWGFSCLDEDYSIVNQLFKYLKLGFGRVNDQVCEAINAKGMTREEGLKLLDRYDGNCDDSFIRRFCHYIGISLEEFWEVAEQYRNHDIWEKDKNEQWKLTMEV